MDADGDLDVFISGLAETGIVTSLYRNEGKKRSVLTPGVDSLVVFTPVDQPFERVAYSRAAWADFDRDGDLDLVVQGSRTADVPYKPITALYSNNGGNFSKVESAELLGLHSGALEWIDFDNDGDLDLLAAGEDSEANFRTNLYVSDGEGGFREIDSDLIDVAYGDADWADFDGDGDFDLALAGTTPNGFAAKIYENDAGTFREHAASLEGVAFASLAWGDYDGDSDPDLLLAGGRMATLLFRGRARLYRNDNGAFAAVDLNMYPALAGSVSWGDYDSDGDGDAFIVGAESHMGHRVARLFAIDGAILTLKSYLIGSMFMSADWGDMDNDGDLDLLTSGQTSLGHPSTTLYENKRQVKPKTGVVPLTVNALVEGSSVRLSWDDSTGLPTSTYAVRVGTAPGQSDVLAPAVDMETGRRLRHQAGNAGTAGKWILRSLSPGTYYWAVQNINAAFQPSAFSSEGTFRIERVTTSVEGNLPIEFRVHPNYPNPFSDMTSIRLDLPAAARVEVVIYSVLGAVVTRIVDEIRQRGSHTITWEGRDAAGRRVSSGIYLYRIRADERLESGRMVVVR